MRQKHRGDYLFRRSGEEGNLVYSVALRTGLPVVGDKTERFALAHASWLLAPLTLEALLQRFVNLQRPVLKPRFPLRLLSQKPANLLPSHPALPTWLQRRLVLEFETRTVKDSTDTTSSAVSFSFTVTLFNTPMNSPSWLISFRLVELER